MDLLACITRRTVSQENSTEFQLLGRVQHTSVCNRSSLCSLVHMFAALVRLLNRCALLAVQTLTTATANTNANANAKAHKAHSSVAAVEVLAAILNEQLFLKHLFLFFTYRTVVDSTCPSRHARNSRPTCQSGISDKTGATCQSGSADKTGANSQWARLGSSPNAELLKTSLYPEVDQLWFDLFNLLATLLLFLQTVHISPSKARVSLNDRSIHSETIFTLLQTNLKSILGLHILFC